MLDTHSAAEIRFVLTPHLQAACRKCNAALLKSSSALEEIVQAAEAKLDSDQAITATISLAGVKLLSQHLQGDSADGKDVWVHQLLRGSRMYIEAPPAKPRNPELAARLDKIKKQLEEQEYKRMTASVSVRIRGIPAHSLPGDDLMLPAVPGVRTGQSPGFGSIKQEMGAVNQQISVIINILFSALGVGFAVAYASYTLTPYIGYRVLLGLGSAMLIALAETWLFAFSGTRGQKKRLNVGRKPNGTATGNPVASGHIAAKKES
ncbi:hypothetical protein IWW37_000803 [Coemansia sp. RSA 2050]|nr:hypothetical protein IWW37_000803 [Coemansia sp. RSA 2050]KAJ2736581.1 hypothetical protein IW152_000756 [Coemansia sp. BCRC 34962]